MQYKCLSIAGFDGSGGAGIQADLKTFSALGCYGMTVLTALPVQNTQGVKSCYPLPLSAIKEQLEAIFEDITPDAIKIGMLYNEDIITIVSDFLQKNALNIPLVLDPVMVAKSGNALLLPEAVNCLKEKLIPLTTIITPNLPEAYALVGECETDELCIRLSKLGSHSVLVKGGHALNTTSDDILIEKGAENRIYSTKRIDTKNTHGTGCTLSAAICAMLATGLSLNSAVKASKEYLTGALEAAKNNSVGKGHGPVHHFYKIWDKN